MNRQKSIALFAVIAAISMTTIGLTGVSSTSLAVSSLPQSEEVGMLGHVQYTVLNSDYQVTRYMQGDNSVVNEGKDCVGAMVFNATDSGTCVDVDYKYEYIAVGNGTQGVAIPEYSDLQMLTNATTNSGCAYGSPGTGGELSRQLVTPTFTNGGSNAVNTTGTSGDGAKIVLNTDTPFAITADNATTIYQSGIFNFANTQVDGQCSSITKADQNMFSIQELNNANGIDVTAGDSLSVKWTITVG